MKLKDILNIDNIKSFIEGNFKYLLYQIKDIQPHIEEQIGYRILQCKDDCIPNEKCKECNCPTDKKMLVVESCNGGERFPNLMHKEEWEQYKKDNNIEI